MHKNDNKRVHKQRGSIDMNTTIQPAVFQDIGAQILKKPPSDTETLKYLWRNKFGATPLVCCFLWDQLAEA